MKKEFWKSLTFYGALMIALGGAGEALGWIGALKIATDICLILGLPVTGFGIRRAMN